MTREHQKEITAFIRRIKRTNPKGAKWIIEAARAARKPRRRDWALMTAEPHEISNAAPRGSWIRDFYEFSQHLNNHFFLHYDE